MSKNSPKSYNHSDLYFKLGQETPYPDVNISYNEIPAITQDNINIINTFQHTQIDFISDTFVPDYNHILWDFPEREQNVISQEDIMLTNLTTHENNKDGTPLYYKYNSRYLHKKETENIDNEIYIADKNHNPITTDNFPYIIEYNNVYEDYYSIEFKLSHHFSDTFYLHYNPQVNRLHNNVNLPEHYQETINEEEIFNEISHDDFINKTQNNNHNIQDTYYSIYQSRGTQTNDMESMTYQVKVPHKAETQPFDGYNVTYQDAPPAITNYRMYGKGYKENDNDGLLLYFLYDESGSMGNHVDDMDNAVNTFMQELNDELPFDPVFNVGHYSSSFSWYKGNGELYTKDELGTIQSNAGGMTALHDAFVTGVDSMIAESSKDKYGHNPNKIIITMTDGRENKSDSSESDVIDYREKAINNGIRLFSIGYEAPMGDTDDIIYHMAEDEDHVVKGENANETLEIIMDMIYQPVYMPMIPSTGSEGLIRDPENLPGYKQGWAKGEEKILEDNINYPNYNLEDMTLHFEVQEDECIDYTKMYVNDTEYIGDTVLNVPNEIDQRDNISIKTKSKCIETYYSRLYFIRSKDQNNPFEVRLPERNENQPWPVEVKNGQYIKQKTIDDIHYDNGEKQLQYVYELNEYKDQDWHDKGKPYKEHSETPDYLDEYKIQLTNKNLYTETIIDNETNFVVPDPYFLNINSNTIIDWNNNDGILTLLEPIDRDDKLDIDYIYQEEWYEYNGFYFNTDTDNTNQIFSPFDLNPKKGHLFGDMGFDDVVIKHGYEIAGEVIYLYIRPSHVKVKEDGQFVDIPESKRFSTLFHNIGELNTLASTFFNRTKHEHIERDDMLLLAKIYINPENEIDDMKIVDTRTRGGGVRKEDYEKIINNLHEELSIDDINTYWDIAPWDGDPYPATGAIVIEVPESVLDKLSHEEVEQKIEKYLGLGIVPIIRYV